MAEETDEKAILQEILKRLEAIEQIVFPDQGPIEGPVQEEKSKSGKTIELQKEAKKELMKQLTEKFGVDALKWYLNEGSKARERNRKREEIAKIIDKPIDKASYEELGRVWEYDRKKQEEQRDLIKAKRFEEFTEGVDLSEVSYEELAWIYLANSPNFRNQTKNAPVWDRVLDLDLNAKTIMPAPQDFNAQIVREVQSRPDKPPNILEGSIKPIESENEKKKKRESKPMDPYYYNW